MSKNFRFFFMILLLSNTISAQQLVQVRGKVSDIDGLSMPNATIRVLNTNSSVLADSAGRFVLSLAPGRYTVQTTATGYADQSRDIDAIRDMDLSVFLQKSVSQLDAVVVTAQKREENLQLVPVSITAIPSRKVREYRLWSNQQIRGIVPTLYSSNPGDNRNVTSIRGVTSTSYDPAVATYIDGVNQFNLDTYIAELIDVERIEILRGPQATLYGRNAMGGVINIITKQPTNETAGFAEASVGNYGQQRYSAGVRTAIIDDKLFAGVSALYNKRDGFYFNNFNNTSFDKQHSTTGNYYLKYLAGNSWSFTWNLKHHHNRNNGPFTLINGVDQAFEAPFQINQNATTTMIDNVFNTSFSVAHTGSKLNFSSQTAYQSNHRYYRDPIDGDFSPLDAITIINNYGKQWNNVKVLTQEFRLSSPAANSGPLTWTAGSYFFYLDNPVKQATRFGENADLLGIPDKNFSIINTTKAKGFGASAFGQAEYRLTSKLSFIAGLRYDYERKRQSVLGEYQRDPNPDPLFETQPDTSATAGFHAWSPKAGLTYAISQNSRAYFTYSRGYRAGGFTPLGSDASQPPLYPFDPEYSNNFEIGWKNMFLNNRLRTNITVFYVAVRDAQVPTLVLPDAITITRNAGQLESRGVELEFAATVIPGLELDYSFGYTDAEYKTLNVSRGGGTVDLSGKKQIFTPNLTSGLAAQYSLMLDERRNTRLIFRGEWFYFGRQYFDLDNNIGQGSYNILNARAGLAIQNMELMFWGRNLADTRYIDFAYDFGAVHLADPKTYGVTISVRF